MSPVAVSLQSLQATYDAVVAQLTPAFREGVNVPLLLGQVFETMLFFALQVLEGRLPHDEATARLTYRQIYSFIAPHIRTEQEKG